MSQPLTVLPADPSIQVRGLKKDSSSIPPEIRAAMKSGKIAKPSAPAPPSSGANPSSAESKQEESPLKLLESKIKAVATTHPHLPIFECIQDALAIVSLRQSQLGKQQIQIAEAHNQLLQLIAQLQAHQAPIHAWMEKVSAATVVTEMKIHFPPSQVDKPEFSPMLPVPKEVSMEEDEPSEAGPGTQPLSPPQKE